MGALSFGVVFGCLMVLIEAQNMTSPMDILNSMKTSVETAAGGGVRIGPMGILGDVSGQFGVKVNKEQTSYAATSAVAKRVGRGRLLSALGPKDGGGPIKLILGTKKSVSKEDPKNCYGRYNRPVIIPIIVSTTAATTTTTAAAN